MTVLAGSSAVRRLPQPPFGLARQSLGGLRILLPFAVLAAIWWIVAATGNFAENVLVSPPAAWRAFLHLTTHGVMAEYASTSLTMIGVASLISMAFGVPIGFAVGINRYA